MGCGASKSTQVAAATPPTKTQEKSAEQAPPAKPTEAFVEKKEEVAELPKKEESNQQPAQAEAQPTTESHPTSHKDSQPETSQDHTAGVESESAPSPKAAESVAEAPKEPEVVKEEHAPKKEEHPFQVEHKSEPHHEPKIEIEPAPDVVPQIVLQASDSVVHSARPTSPAPAPDSPAPLTAPLSPRKITEERLPHLPLRQLSAELQRPRSLSPRHPVGLKLPPIGGRSSTLAAMLDHDTKTKVSSNDFKDALSLDEPNARSLKRSATSHNIAADALVQVDKNLFPGAKKKGAFPVSQSDPIGRPKEEAKEDSPKQHQPHIQPDEKKDVPAEAATSETVDSPPAEAPAHHVPEIAEEPKKVEA